MVFDEDRTQMSSFSAIASVIRSLTATISFFCKSKFYSSSILKVVYLVMLVNSMKGEMHALVLRKLKNRITYKNYLLVEKNRVNISHKIS